MDVADQSDAYQQVAIDEALYLHRSKMIVTEAEQCQHCEEYPPMILPRGTRSKFCVRCMSELGIAIPI